MKKLVLTSFEFRSQGFNKSPSVFTIIITPIEIPTIPTKIAKTKNCFFRNNIKIEIKLY